MIDLRSDTVTRPSDAMRRAMAAAPVGDDQYGEDPTVNRLQEHVAALLGKEAALFVPSGTMANQLALKLLTRPGDDVVVGQEAHAVWHETGGARRTAACSSRRSDGAGSSPPATSCAAYKAPGHVVYPPTTLVEVENTHNRGGGPVFPHDDATAICAEARRLGVASYLDGARLFNASVATGIALADLAAPFDLAAVALSKGLGAPVGSVLAGRRDDIVRAVRYRRMLGGGDAPGRDSCGRGPVRPRPQHSPAGRGPRQRAADRRPAAGEQGDRPRSRDRADQHPGLPGGRGVPASCSARRRRACSSARSARG